MLAAIFGSIGVGIVLAIVIALIIWKIVRDKKAGKSFCGGNCNACGAGCHRGCSGCPGTAETDPEETE